MVAAGLIAWISRQPMLFASLGPTVYELIEQPHRKSARPYNVVVGHLTGVAAGFAALSITHAWYAPSVSGTTHVALIRVGAAAIAALLTVLGTLLLRATQPAALSTTLVIALGAMQQWKDGLLIMASIGLIVLLGEPLRRWRHQRKGQQEQER